MATWTPALEKQIKNFADNAEKQMKDYINPKLTIAETFARVTRRDDLVNPAYKAICAEIGIPLNGNLNRVEGFAKNLQKIIDFAQQNGSSVADKLAKVIAAEQKIDALADRTVDPLKAAKTVKAASLQY